MLATGETEGKDPVGEADTACGRRRFHLFLLFAVFIIGSPPVFADEFPRRQIRIVVPYPAGGPTDALARLVAADR